MHLSINFLFYASCCNCNFIKTSISCVITFCCLCLSSFVTSKTQYALATGYILKNYASVKQVVAATVSAAAGGQLDEATVSSKADQQMLQ